MEKKKRRNRIYIRDNHERKKAIREKKSNTNAPKVRVLSTVTYIACRREKKKDRPNIPIVGVTIVRKFERRRKSDTIAPLSFEEQKEGKYKRKYFIPIHQNKREERATRPHLYRRRSPEENSVETTPSQQRRRKLYGRKVIHFENE